MKILQITKKFPYPKKDGEAWAVLALAQGLREQGALVSLFSLNTEQHTADQDQIEALRQQRLYEEIIVVGAEVRPSKVGAAANLLSSKSYHEARFSNIKSAKEELRQHLDSADYDVLLVESAFMQLLVEALDVDIPVVIRAHNAEHQIWERYSERKKGIKAWYFDNQAKRLRHMEQRLYDQSDLIWALSTQDQETLETMVEEPKKISVLPIGMEVSDHIISEDLDTPMIIGSIGSLDWRPNVEGMQWFLDEVWPLYLDTQEDVILMVAGRNARKSSSWKKKPNVSYLGEVEDSVGFLQQIDVLIVPLWSGSGTRVKILQALGLGIPVIATSVAAEGLGVEHDKNILLADTPEKWCEMLGRAEDFKQRAALSEQGKAYIQEHHSIQSIGELAYQKLVEVCGRR